jgi:hypothetical protein
MFGQVHGLAPGTGSGLDKGDVDQQHVPVADQQVGRLDVAVGQPGVPQPPDDPKAVVDHGLVDLGLAQLHGAVEELGDQQVLPLGGQSRNPWGLGLGRPASRHSRRA